MGYCKFPSLNGDVAKRLSFISNKVVPDPKPGSAGFVKSDADIRQRRGVGGASGGGVSNWDAKGGGCDGRQYGGSTLEK